MSSVPTEWLRVSEAVPERGREPREVPHYSTADVILRAMRARADMLEMPDDAVMVGTLGLGEFVTYNNLTARDHLLDLAQRYGAASAVYKCHNGDVFIEVLFASGHRYLSMPPAHVEFAAVSNAGTLGDYA